eukprot:TRINITY_DN5449_c0_g2_i1.p1 TRINITY_DN5449_c0_g2~~TRINITY_DN5449_c0_g2_i1.p1  ORF type:complete len:779 (-),score=154.24 TRINITY_DN5449_c0_g2_i1:124-2367(-)
MSDENKYRLSFKTSGRKKFKQKRSVGRLTERKSKMVSGNYVVDDWEIEDNHVGVNVDALRDVMGSVLGLYGLDDSFKFEILDIVENRAKMGEDVDFDKKYELLSNIKEYCGTQMKQMREKDRPVRKIQSYIRKFMIQEHRYLLDHTDITDIFDELFISEMEYLKALETIKTDYKHTLQIQKNILKINEKDIAMIFGSIDSLYQLSTTVVEKLKYHKTYHPIIFNLGNTFLSLVPKFYVYGLYLEKLNVSLITLRDTRITNRKFENLLESIQVNSSFPKQDLASLLSLPKNRIDTYEMFIGKMVSQLALSYKRTSSESETSGEHKRLKLSTVQYDQFNYLKEAHTSIMQINAFLYNTETTVNAKLIDRVQNMIPGLDLKLNESKQRKFLREGVALWKGKQNDYFLFSDLVIFANDSKHFVVFLNDCEILSDPEISDNTEWIEFKMGLKGKKVSDSQGPEISKKATVSILSKDKEFFEILKQQLHITKSAEKIIGVSLEQLSERKNSMDGVPFVVRSLIGYISKKQNLKKKGLFRISGENSLMMEWIEKYSSGEEVELDDVHTAAELLKYFFRSLPVPLFPFETYPLLIEFHDSYERGDPSANLIRLKKILEKMPKVHIQVFQHLRKFLFRVTRYEETNLMGMENLTIVLGTNLLRPKVEDYNTTLEMGKVHRIVKIIFENYKYLFESFEEIEFYTEDNRATIIKSPRMKTPRTISLDTSRPVSPTIRTHRRYKKSKDRKYRKSNSLEA